ncbi:MAG: hypothetical protein HW412_2309 [Bacteroidetes bacterium]|nr:hypothetical protein [Bacteroidota bacterium]
MSGNKSNSFDPATLFLLTFFSIDVGRLNDPVEIENAKGIEPNRTSFFVSSLFLAQQMASCTPWFRTTDEKKLPQRLTKDMVDSMSGGLEETLPALQLNHGFSMLPHSRTKESREHASTTQNNTTRTIPEVHRDSPTTKKRMSMGPRADTQIHSRHAH